MKHLFSYFTKLRVLALAMLVVVGMISARHGAVVGVYSFIACALALDNIRQKHTREHILCAYTGVQLSDIFIPRIYQDQQVIDGVERLMLLQSGILGRSPQLTAVAQSGAQEATVPFWNDLDASSEPNVSDDTDTLLVVDDVDTTSLKVRNAFLAKGWGTADLAAEIAGSMPGQGNPMTRIKQRVENYWSIQLQKRLISASRGVLASNIANNASDMLYNIATETGNSATDDNKISAEAVISAMFTMGDRFDDLKLIAMHSLMYQRLVNQQLIEFVKEAENTVNYPTYLGKRVIVDDDMPVIAGGVNGFKYLTMLFGAGAFGYGEGTPMKPAEVERIPRGGNGAGLENFITRKTWLLHPAGFNWTDNTRVGNSAINSELATAANWTRIFPRKMCKIAYLQTN